MPKSQYTPEALYEAIATREWIQTQDFNMKFKRLSKKRQAAYKAMAAQLMADESPLPTVTAPSNVGKKAAKASKKSPSKPRPITGYKLYADRLRAHMEKGKMDVNSIPASEIKKQYRALAKEKRKRYEDKATALMANQ